MVAMVSVTRSSPCSTGTPVPDGIGGDYNPFDFLSNRDLIQVRVAKQWGDDSCVNTEAVIPKLPVRDRRQLNAVILHDPSLPQIPVSV